MLKQINKEIVNELDLLSYKLLFHNTKNNSFEFDYNKEDIMNSVIVFSEIISNYSLKQGFLTIENAEEFGTGIRNMIINYCGFDPHNESKKQYESL